MARKMVNAGLEPGEESRMSKLLSCPFCGADVKIEPIYDTQGYITAVWCANDPECGAMVTFVGNESKKKAIAAWNRRAAPEEGAEHERD